MTVEENVPVVTIALDADVSVFNSVGFTAALKVRDESHGESLNGQSAFFSSAPGAGETLAPAWTVRPRWRDMSPAARVAVWSLLLACGLAVLVLSAPFRARLAANQVCCQVPFARNLVVTANELLGRASYPSQIGQDRWVLETMFPDVTDGYFLDVGSGDGLFHSNTVALERRGWRGICVDPFPSGMETRTCQVFRDVVWSTPGRVMTFHMADGLAGLADTLGRWRTEATRAPAVELKTVTLDQIVTAAKAPAFVHFMSLDIEGAELEALKAFPFDRIRLGALAIEHNYERDKRARIVEFLGRHGYVRVHSFRHDDYFAPASGSQPAAVRTGRPD